MQKPKKIFIKNNCEYFHKNWTIKNSLLSRNTKLNQHSKIETENVDFSYISYIQYITIAVK